MSRLNDWHIILKGADSAAYEAGLANLLETCKLFKPFSCEIELVPHTDNSCLFHVEAENGRARLSCREKSAFFHALLCMAEQEGGKRYEISRSDRFSGMQFMIDLSRNAVYTVNEMKKVLCRLALLGYNACLMYMEDIYSIPEYPMFGYLRGKYSREELKQLDDFAQSLGIELIPCVQSLAHLRTALRWRELEGIRDTADNLLVGCDETYEFIEAMIRELKTSFKSGRIHIGMDEAMTLGHGTYLRTQGYRKSSELMREHVTRVMDIVKKHSLKPMIWDDMLFRSNGDGGYYNNGLNKKLLDSLPAGIEYVYWDYYHEDKAHYDRQLKMRDEMNPIFAGGIWKWTGYAPNFEKTWATTIPALEACLEHGVKEIIATAWADDSAETPLASILPGLALYGESRFGRADNAAIDRHCQILAGIGLDDFFTIEGLELIPGYNGPNLETAVPAKQILYSDILCGLFDWHYARPEIAEYYKGFEKQMLEIEAKTPEGSDAKPLFHMYAAMARLLCAKLMLGKKLRRAYNENNKEQLLLLAADIDGLVPMAEAFHESVADIWSDSSKGQGLEVLDTRLGGLSGRYKTASRRVRAYANGRLERIEELEEEILPYDGISEGRLPNTFYIDTVTANSFVYFALF